MTSLRRFALAAVAVLLIGMGPVVSEADAKKKHKHDAHCRHDDHRGNARWHRDGDGRDRRHYDSRARYDHLGRRQTGRDRRNNPEFRANAAKCAEIDERIGKANQYIDRWHGTGRHEKAQEWFHKDLRKAHAERAQYCGGRACRSGWWRDTSYDDRRNDDDWYDGRYYGEDQDFDFKRDWPALLGVFGGLNAGAN